jgi:nucleotide-binding universal stress UspA family protein
MIKTILAHLTGLPSDEGALETAYLIARPFDAHVEGLHVSPAWSQIAATVAAQNLDSATSPVDVFAAFEKEAKNMAWRANRHFAEFRRRWNVPLAETPPGPHRVSAAWREVKGDLVEATVVQARFHDLVVAARAAGSACLDEVILNSGRPILLAPRQTPENLGSTIAIAWKESAEAARAVTAAMPLLKKADKILVVSAQERSGSGDVFESAERLAQYLRWHGTRVEAHCVSPGDRNVTDAIVRTAQDHKAELLVMGGYGHSRFHEFVLGGATRDVLRECSLPVFLFH